MEDELDSEQSRTRDNRAWQGGRSGARRAAIALMAEPAGFTLFAIWMLVWEDPAASSVSILVGLTALSLTAVASIYLWGVGLRFFQHSRSTGGKTYGLQRSQYSLRFGHAGNELFDGGGFTPFARNVQRVSTFVAFVLLVAGVAAAG